MFEQIPVCKKTHDPLPGAAESGFSDPCTTLGSIEIQPSRWLWRIQILIHLIPGLLLVVALVPLLRENIIWLALLGAWIAIISVSLYRFRRTTPLQPEMLSHGPQGWFIAICGRQRSVALVGEAVVWSWLVILKFKDREGGRVTSLVLLPDSVSAENLRRLKVWLRATTRSD